MNYACCTIGYAVRQKRTKKGAQAVFKNENIII